RKQLVRAFHFHQTQAAGANVRQSLQFAEARNEDLVLPRHVENAFVGTRTEIAAIDLKRLYSNGRIHAPTSLNSFTPFASSDFSLSPSAWRLQTPATHFLS